MTDEKDVEKLLEKKAKLDDDKGQVMEDLIKEVKKIVETQDKTIKTLKDFVINMEKIYNTRVDGLEKDIRLLREKILLLFSNQYFLSNDNSNHIRDIKTYLDKKIMDYLKTE